VLRLEVTEDVIAALASDRHADQTFVGFAAEHGAEAIVRAREKLERKGLDAIVFNDVSRSDIGFDAERNEVTIVDRSSEVEVSLADKDEVAAAVLDRVATLRAEHAERRS
jgi:phosphopantothenoylcysteine decarboxylase / phosphopantothenate---cysteine ligase